MKKWLSVCIAAVLVLGATVYVAAQGQPGKLRKGMVLGEVVDIFGYISRGAMGERYAEAGKFRAEKGFPVGILEDETGKLFIAVYKNPAPASGVETANKKLAELVGKKAIAQGQIWEKDGLQAIQIRVVSEAF